MLRICVHCLSCYKTDGKNAWKNNITLSLKQNDLTLRFIWYSTQLYIRILPFVITLQPRDGLCLAGKCICVNKENGCTRLKTVVARRSGEVIVCKDKDEHVTRSREILLWERTYTILHDDSHSFYLRKINRVYFLYIPTDETEILNDVRGWSTVAEEYLVKILTCCWLFQRHELKKFLECFHFMNSVQNLK